MNRKRCVMMITMPKLEMKSQETINVGKLPYWPKFRSLEYLGSKMFTPNEIIDFHETQTDRIASSFQLRKHIVSIKFLFS